MHRGDLLGIGLERRVPRQHHYFGANHLRYLTTSTYRRARLFVSDRFKLKFAKTLDELRLELGVRTKGYLLMPESCTEKPTDRKPLSVAVRKPESIRTH